MLAGMFGLGDVCVRVAFLELLSGKVIKATGSARAVVEDPSAHLMRSSFGGSVTSSRYGRAGFS